MKTRNRLKGGDLNPEKSGGRELEHWLEAERIVSERYAMETPGKKKPKEEKKTVKSVKKSVKTQKRKK